MTAAVEGGEWSAARPGRTLPPGKTGYPFYRRLGGPKADLYERKISSPLGFAPGPSARSSVAIPTELPGPQNISEKTIIKTKYDSVNHARFAKEDHLPDWARWDDKFAKGDRVEAVEPNKFPQSLNPKRAQKELC